MKIASAFAALLTLQRHSIWALAAAEEEHEQHEHERELERELLLNQAKAADRVNDIVEDTMAYYDEDDVKGVALPLNYVKLSVGPQQLTMALRLPGVEREQHVMIDTGSSSLAFCDKSLIDEAVGITRTDYAQCKAYSRAISCANENDPSTSLHRVFYVGQIYEGNVTASYETSNGDELFIEMEDVNFAIMSKRQIYACSGPLDGVFGVAFDALHRAVELPSPDFDLWHESCESDDPFYKSVGYCKTYNTFLKSVSLPSPLEQTLKEDTASGNIEEGAFGLYCDYAATIGSQVDTIVPSLGIFFGGDMALNNTFYNSGTPQAASLQKCNSKMQWYLLKLNSIRIPAMNMTQSGFDQCKCDGVIAHCFTDSGDSKIRLPLPKSQCDVLTNTNIDSLKTMGSMLLDIEGIDGETVTLSLPLLWLREQLELGNVVCTGSAGNFLLGFPIFQYYYLVFDMADNRVTFVDLQLSDEAKAFIDGPEYGGMNSGYHRHVLSTSSLVAVAIFFFLL